MEGRGECNGTVGSLGHGGCNGALASLVHAECNGGLGSLGYAGCNGDLSSLGYAGCNGKFGSSGHFGFDGYERLMSYTGCKDQDGILTTSNGDKGILSQAGCIGEDIRSFEVCNGDESVVGYAGFNGDKSVPSHVECNGVDCHFTGPQEVVSSKLPSRPKGKSELIILGSGCSTGVPSPHCLMQPTQPPCLVCHIAMEGSPELNKNYRCNPSLLIDYLHEDGTRRYIQIDAGKNFKEQVLRWFVLYKVPRLDALILTHEHADATLGLDDIRGVQEYNADNKIEPIPIFLSQQTMDSIHQKFPYLVNKISDGAEFRRVSQLEWRVIETAISKFKVAGLDIMTLPVMHGEDNICLGFLFGKACRVAYISDVSRIPLQTELEISADGVGPVDILILDCLYKVGPHNTHFCWDESLAAVKRLRPKRAFFVGMTHEFHHERENAELAVWSEREGIDVQLAYDGMKLLVDI